MRTWYNAKNDFIVVILTLEVLLSPSKTQDLEWLGLWGVYSSTLWSWDAMGLLDSSIRAHNFGLGSCKVPECGIARIAYGIFIGGVNRKLLSSIYFISPPNHRHSHCNWIRVAHIS